MANKHTKRCASLISRGMQIEATVRYHLTLLGWLLVRNKRENNMSAGYGKIGTFVHCWWECKVVLVTVQTSMAVPQKN